ncbi:MAG: hypothetical protein HY922_09820, partial [Elusimicrobia bacterium]|nr:hypothetical protein [Elusimicrobiota bacterium]
VYLSTSARILLEAADPRSPVGITSGVDKTFYSLDGGSPTVYAGAFSIPAEGAHAIGYYSVDKASNTEAQH